MNFKSFLRKFLVKLDLVKILTFYAETVTSEPVVDPTQIDWQQRYKEKSIAEVLRSEGTFLINESDDKIADDEQFARRVKAPETLASLNAAKCFAETHGEK